MKLLCLANLVLSTLCFASAPQVKTPPPGYYRLMIGDIEVTPLLDGLFTMQPVGLLKGIKPPEATKLLHNAYQTESIPTSVIGYLVNTGTKLVLIDSGVGTLGAQMGPGLGKLLENLKAAGYQPDQVDEVYLTHMHTDHLGGLVTDGKRNFPNAVLRADKKDVDFWLSDAEAAKAPEGRLKSMMLTAKSYVGLYQAADKFKAFEGDTELVPGVHAHAAYGHTPGHTVYTIESQGKKLWLLGDMIHVAAVQFPKPEVAMMFDSNIPAAVAERAKDFGAAAKAGDLIGAAHLSFPGIGHIRKSGSGFSYTPIAFGQY